MKTDIPFTIYNAAAGAGKTYTLVKEYLITLLNAPFKDGYKNILAITFTNKAVAEMKTRVLENLIAIGAIETPKEYQPLLQDLIEETKKTKDQVKKKALKILKSILHNYAAFDIVTIDTFTHRVIRTFAHDLGIPINFEIEMDTETLIEESVNALISRIGLDRRLTTLIIDFAFDKLEEDKSWDITLELNKIAKLLHSENDRKHVHQISDIPIDDFEILKKLLFNKIEDHKKLIVSKAENILLQISNHGILHTDFQRSSIPNHFQKLVQGETKIDFNAAWKQDIHTASFYSAKLETEKKTKIDTIRTHIENEFLATKNLLTQIHFYKNGVKNLTPLSVLSAINKELHLLKKERKILLISEFNAIISTNIQGQPAPFIYERLGERYRDYFIDEFQDTSALQWNNLIPLIDNAVATETLTGKKGKITIVGDAKQAIYRWRGGKAEQFIELSADKNPFSVQEKQVLNLPKNYRSHEEIITFNNQFFTFLSKDFSNPIHKELYLQGNRQEVNHKKNGHVNVSFINAKNITEEYEEYPKRVLEIILQLKEKGYGLKDICIIVRKQKEGIAIANFLTDYGLPIISSETLLINNATEVRFMIDLMTWYINPNDLLAKINALHFIANTISEEKKHTFLQKMIATQKEEFLAALKILGIDFDFNQLAIKPLYDAIEYVISCFNLAKTTPIYLQFFLDIVFSFAQKKTGGIHAFLAYWETKKNTLSIIAPDTQDAIKIMTIHKAKGLEFPCVIYPFANIDIYREIEPKTWVPVSAAKYAGFNELFIDYSKSIAEYSEKASIISSERRAQLELDAFNLLYVVFTRAKEQLYIISKLELNSRGENNPNRFSGKLIEFLKHIEKWTPEKLEYSFGNLAAPFQKEIEKNKNTLKLSHFENQSKTYAINIVTKSGKLWDTAQKNAIEKGNLIHDLLASIYTIRDIDTVMEEACSKGEITSIEKKLLTPEITKIVTHPELSEFFSLENTVYSEREIISEGAFFRPDRIVVHPDNTTSIIDYKTGDYRKSHIAQIEKYATILKKADHIIKNKIIVYLNENIMLERI